MQLMCNETWKTQDLSIPTLTSTPLSPSGNEKVTHEERRQTNGSREKVL